MWRDVKVKEQKSKVSGFFGELSCTSWCWVRSLTSPLINWFGWWLSHYCRLNRWIFGRESKGHSGCLEAFGISTPGRTLSMPLNWDPVERSQNCSETFAKQPWSNYCVPNQILPKKQQLAENRFAPKLTRTCSRVVDKHFAKKKSKIICWKNALLEKLCSALCWKALSFREK